MPHADRQAGRARSAFLVVVALAGLVVAFAAPAVVAGERPGVAEARAATARFHDLGAAEAAGYGLFYQCTDNESLGAAMGQHYVNGGLVGDGVLDVSRPEVLVYEPRRGGGYKLVAVEYVEIAEVWDATHASPPRLFGKQLTRVPAGNRYGLPDFYEIHAWIWAPNPRGMFDDWNPRVTCRGQGDPA